MNHLCNQKGAKRGNGALLESAARESGSKWAHVWMRMSVCISTCVCVLHHTNEKLEWQLKKPKKAIEGDKRGIRKMKKK